MLETELGSEQDPGNKGHEQPGNIRDDTIDPEAPWRPA
jgi:hypothetical protein